MKQRPQTALWTDAEKPEPHQNALLYTQPNASDSVWLARVFQPTTVCCCGLQQPCWREVAKQLGRAGKPEKTAQSMNLRAAELWSILRACCLRFTCTRA